MAEVKQIDSKTLVSWLETKKEFTILDIRPQTERDEWFIPESKYFNAYDELMPTAEIVTGMLGVLGGIFITCLVSFIYFFGTF